MVEINNSMYTPKNVGLDPNANQSSVGSLKAISHEDFGPRASQEFKTDFASAFYGDGPYSLEHPNNTTEILAQNVDYLA